MKENVSGCFFSEHSVFAAIFYSFLLKPNSYNYNSVYTFYGK